MAQGHLVDTTWMWHPGFTECRTDTAGLFLHFRRALLLAPDHCPSSLKIQITADTRYKLYVNQVLVTFGPVKGDASVWFYDEIDLGPFLRPGRNAIAVTVLRFFHATSYATSFPRLPLGGLRIITSDPASPWRDQIRSGPLWETAIDTSTILRVDEPEDDFLHIYEHVVPCLVKPTWVPAQVLQFQISTGNSVPWKLSPRLIPMARCEPQFFSAVHNLQSNVPLAHWEAILVGKQDLALSPEGVHLAPFTSHHLDLEVPHHLTGFLKLHFVRPENSGSVLRVKYAESYEDTPRLVPYLRSKGNRRDFRKSLFGPEDIYEFQGTQSTNWNSLDDDVDSEEVFAPFHFRTFRFAQLRIDVGSSELVLRRASIQMVQYPLKIAAQFSVQDTCDLANQLWATSVRTLNNCMHDCYEDCPFYEQLQYAMDTRSSALFTYCVSADDRLARQAIVQLHNSFNPHIGLTSSRAPTHKVQIIPHFSLFWICMLSDHLTFFGDKDFIHKFVPVVDAVLGYFDRLLDPLLGLVLTENRDGIWNFVDWAEQWRPYGIPPAAARTGVSTYTNNLYAYALRKASQVLWALGRLGMAEEYLQRANRLVLAIHRHCFDGRFFTDGLAAQAELSTDYSQHNQVWAVLSGAAAVAQDGAEDLLRRCLDGDDLDTFVPASLAMSHYTLRALSKAGGGLYERHFHKFWQPWAEQLALNLTTWEEDSVSQRSDCHAWGSVPIYEFLVEVVGLRPAHHGWAAVIFQPRISLYPRLQATVPLQRNGENIGLLAHVSWTPTSDGTTIVRLHFEASFPIVVPVFVRLPSQPERLMDSASDMEFHIRGGEMKGFPNGIGIKQTEASDLASRRILPEAL
ncbi:Six-hairpin glycosidase [Thozetella sp. PMI_491]|nr:Six-hairpin glycosidase [Thozetella sp. PMI_491]